MKIKELIKELNKCNPEGEVFIFNEIYGMSIPVKEVIDYCGDEESYIIEPDEDA